MKISLSLFGCFDSIEELEEELSYMISVIKTFRGEDDFFPNMGSNKIDWEARKTDSNTSFDIKREFLKTIENYPTKDKQVIFDLLAKELNIQLT